MGRRSHTRTLSLWMNGERVGDWVIPTRGAMELRYDPEWIASSSGRPLSLSLPFRLDDRPIHGAVVEHWFDNLLPDSDAIRKRLATRFKTGSTQAFDLLRAVGRDCVGALQLLPADAEPGKAPSIEGTVLSNQDIEQLLARTPTLPAYGDTGDNDDFRISIAGAQEKTALLLHEGRWMRPHGATPTTHIFKLPIGMVGSRRADFGTSVENEWLCSRILAAYGLPVATCGIGRFGDQKALVVERFDRQLHSSGTWWMRLPQEDFCQVFGLSPLMKYEADGGPGIEKIAGVLAQSVNAKQDLETLITAQIVFWMLAAIDGHAKNFSIRLLAGGLHQLAPLFDLMSAWPIIGDGPKQLPWQRARLAMAVSGKNRHYLLKEIERRHFNAMASRFLGSDSAEAIIERLAEATPAVIERVAAEAPADFPSSVLESIVDGLAASVDRLESARSD